MSLEPYYTTVNEDLLNLIPPDAKTILEIGCGAGALAQAYKLRNPACKYYGVEINFDAQQAAQATGCFECTVWDDIEIDVGDWRNLSTGEDMECIVFGDCLEHLTDPSYVLKHLTADILAPSGVILACIPNVQHWTVILNLMNGEWPQMDDGLYDRTHLRWFTKHGMIELFEKAGLTVTKVFPRIFDHGYPKLVEAVRHSQLVEQFQGMPQAIDIAKFETDIKPLQYIIQGVKGEPPKRKIYIRGFAAEACCRLPRMTDPGTFLATIPGVRYSEEKTTIEPGETVIVVRQRFQISEEAIKADLQKGCLVIGEWDDDPRLEYFAKKLQGTTAERMIKSCHAIQVSTDVMADTIRVWNPNVAVFPNQIKELSPPRVYADDDMPVRIFFGAQNRENDWKPLMPALNRIIADFGDKLWFVVMQDRDFWKALETDNKTFYPFHPYKKYREILRTCDIALLPLEDTEANRHKSDIKFLECAVEGVACIVGNTVYEDTAAYEGVHGTSGIRAQICWEIPDFDYSLRDMIENAESRRILAKLSFEYVRDNRLLSQHYKRRHEWYESLLGVKSHLDEQLRERVLGIFGDRDW